MASRQSPDTPAALEIRALDAGYGARPVLRGLRAGPLREGTLTALLGPNGSGKSTLLKTLAGLNPMQAGELRLDGADFGRLPPARRAQHAMYMPQALPRGVHMT
ncbi:ATP-binding cassette domain-containing protein, partial [Achromobacter xylosoxidans]